MKHLFNWLLVAFMVSFAMVSCMGDFDKGKYRRIYGRSSDIYEIVILKDKGIYEQTFYRHGKIHFSNSGQWEYKINQNDSAKWPNGWRIILFSNWLSAEEMLRMEHNGLSPKLSDIGQGIVAAIVRDNRHFAFDEDGGSDYRLE